jgi:hypothetical protein
MTDLRAALELAAEDLETRDLTRDVIAAAHRRRNRRRGTFAAVAAGVAVVGVVAVPRILDASEPVREPTGTPTPDPTPDSEPGGVAVVPPIDVGVIPQPWDPARVAQLPLRNRTLLPTDLTPGPSADRTGERLVAVVDDGSQLHLVTDGERWQTVEYPEPLLTVPDTAVSPDGQRVIVTGASGLWSRDVETATWQRVDYPDGFRPGWELPARLLPLTDSTTYLAQGDRNWLVDLDSGEAERQPFGLDAATTSTTGVVTFGVDGRTRTIVEWEPGPRVVNADALEFLHSPVADRGPLLAAARVNSSYSEPRRGTDLDGLIVLDRTDFTTVAYLSVDDDQGWVEGDGLRPLDWLDGTLLVSVVPPGTGGTESGTRHLVTWDPQTGELARVSSLPAAYDLGLATDVLD